MQGAGCRVQGAGCRVQGAGCRVQGAGCRVQGLHEAVVEEVELLEFQQIPDRRRERRELVVIQLQLFQHLSFRYSFFSSLGGSFRYSFVVQIHWRGHS